MIYNEDDRAQRLLDVFDILPGQVNVSYVNNTSHIVAWHKHNLQTDYWVCLKLTFLFFNNRFRLWFRFWKLPFSSTSVRHFTTNLNSSSI